jgi:hypothetical protein
VDTADPDLAALGIRSDCPLLLCPGSPFKYLPEHDHLLVEVAKRLEDCQFVFFISQWNERSAKLAKRIEGVFREAGLAAEKVVFCPWLRPPEFYVLM